MSQSHDLQSDAVFRIAHGEVESPLVIDVSRSGRLYPAEFLVPASFHGLHTKISPYVERVALPAIEEGATVLMAQFPPTFVDPNRPIDDIDPDTLDGEWPTPLNPLKASVASGTGLIHTQGSNYAPLYEAKLPVRDVQQRITGYYTPYHAALSDLLARRQRKFGFAFQLSCHSMSSVGPKDGVKRPEICLSDLDGATASPAYLELVTSIFSDQGLEVALNKPFRGNELLRRHASLGTGIYSLQVEMRRDLYIDEKTRHLHDGLAVLQDCFRRIAAGIRAMSAI
jgi:N-formylglutamate deformylase